MQALKNEWRNHPYIFYHVFFSRRRSRGQLNQLLHLVQGLVGKKEKMQGVLNLNHFCEQHGPQLLLSTQAFHQPVTAAHAGCEAGAVLASSSSSSSSHCGACGWAAGASSLHSHDSETSTTYISRHYPQRPEVFSLVRRACVRSLSSELCPGRDGPLLFGDGHHGCTLSFNFALTDVQARGGLRHYSLTLVMADSLQLISAWPFLVRHMAVLVKDLKARVRSKAVFDRDAFYNGDEII